MQKSENNQTAPVAHRQVQSSTTLNRKYVRRVDGIVRQAPRTATQLSSVRPVAQPVATKTVTEPPRPTAEELKKRAIEKALQSASKTTAEDVKGTKNAKKTKKKSDKFHFGFGRVVLALACTAAAVFAIVYFVNLNMPDLPLRVAAMQTGIEASYPSYVPRDFSLSDITSHVFIIEVNQFGSGISVTSCFFQIISESRYSEHSSAIRNNRTVFIEFSSCMEAEVIFLSIKVFQT